MKLQREISILKSDLSTSRNGWLILAILCLVLNIALWFK